MNGAITNQNYLYNTETGLLHQLVEEAVEKYADHTAVVHHHQQFTYREVNRGANQLARVLRKAGVKPGHIIAIMVEPSIQMITGILGILKAGGCYLPIDPEYPQKRISFMLKESKAAILITKEYLSESIHWETRETLLIDKIGKYRS